jgi:ABC-type nitrate/sulfonate/bicarbonate transport system substrate-binding protein
MTRRIRLVAAPTGFGRWIARAACLGLTLTAMPGSAARAADKLVLQLHREAQFEFAGYYAALWKGFYREAGLEVEIKPGAPPGATPIDAVREVTERRAQFGTGTAQLLLHTAQGLPLLLLAPIFQQSGTAIYYLADGDLSSLYALHEAKVGRPPPSNFLDVELRMALHGEGIDPDKLKSVSVEPGQAIAALSDHRVDSVIGSAWELPWQARERSVPLKSLSLADYRPQVFGDGLFALQRFANADPATAQRFREASIKGWEYALQHPDEIGARIVAELPVQAPVSDPAGFARYQGEVARKLARFPNVALGQSNPERWIGVQQSLIAIGAISRPADLEAFLYNPGAATWGFSFRLVLLIFAAVAILAGFVAADRFWRWRRRGAIPAEAFNPAKTRKWIPASFLRSRPLMLGRPDLARLCAIAHHGFDRARSITRQLVASTTGGGPALRPTDLGAALTGVEGLIRRRLPGAVKCRLSLLPELQLCHADPDAVTAMVLNLAAEAAADMPNGGDLVVGTRQCTIDHTSAVEFPGSAPGDYVRVTVKDSGSGLSAERLERIFYPEATARPAAAAAWRLTHRLGGFAAVESAEGVGTAVHLYFRRAVDNGETADPPGAVHAEPLAAE